MKVTAWDRFTASFAPEWTLRRLQARAALEVAGRNYDAASPGRRTSSWSRNRGDANATASVASPILRVHARDLLRNNAWARKARSVVVNSMIGTGAQPRVAAKNAADKQAAQDVWRAWANTTDCDANGRTNFAGLEQLIAGALFSDGEVFIRRRWRRPEDGLALPFQLQLLEADFLDHTKNELRGREGGRIINGVEHDAIGRVVAFWFFDEHPGNHLAVASVSRRVAATEVIHVFRQERPGQVRGVSWLAAAIVGLHDLDEYEDAEMLKQKIAACFAGFVTEVNGDVTPIAGATVDPQTNQRVESFEPGMIAHLPPGRDVKFATPPTAVDTAFTVRALRKLAAGLEITYEDLTGDYSSATYSSARMGRLVHQGAVASWQYTLLAPQLHTRVWAWVMDGAVLSNLVREPLGAEWTFPPLPAIEPDKEVLTDMRAVRAGFKSLSGVLRERGEDPETLLGEVVADFAMLKTKGVMLDTDPSQTSQAGLAQQSGGKQSPPVTSETDKQDT